MKYGMLTVFCVLLAGGCQRDKLVQEPPRTGHFYVNPRGDFATVGRVVLLELDNQSNQPDLSETLTAALSDELGKRHLFSIRKLMRSDPIWQALRLDGLSLQNLDELAALRQSLNVDAVMLGTIQRYRPFPNLQVGLNVRLIDLRSGKLLWAIEDVWDSSDKAVEKRMQTFFKEQMRTGYEPMNWQILTTSPRAFDRFVAFEVAQTLPSLPKDNQPRTVEYRRRHLAP